MVKWIILGLMFGSTAHGGTVDTYLSSCRVNYFNGVVASFNGVDTDKVRENAKKLCKQAADANPSLSTIKDPIFRGCWDSVELVFDYDMQPELKKKKLMLLRVQLCSDIGNR